MLTVLLAALLLAPAAAPPCDVLEEFAIGTDEGPIFVPVTIAGKQYPFLIDTGSYYSGYDRSLKPFMGKEVESHPLRTPGGEYRPSLAMPPEARLGRLPLPREQPALLEDYGRYREALGADLFGVVGMDFLARHVVRIDFGRGKLTILRRAPADSGTRVPMRLDNGTALIESDVLGVGPPETFIVATGDFGFASGNLSSRLYDALVERGRVEPAGEGTSETAAGPNGIRGGVLDRFTLGAREHRGLVMLCGSDWSSLGLHFWARYLATFDFPNGFVYLRENASHSGNECTPDCSGLAVLGTREGRALIAAVAAGSPAEAAGLRVGDEVLSIAGRPTATTNLVVLRRPLCFPGQSVSVAVQRGGRVKEASLRLEKREGKRARK